MADLTVVLADCLADHDPIDEIKVGRPYLVATWTCECGAVGRQIRLADGVDEATEATLADIRAHQATKLAAVVADWLDRHATVLVANTHHDDNHGSLTAHTLRQVKADVLQALRDEIRRDAQR